MSVITVTTISCDGSETEPCKLKAAVTYEAIQSIALRLARKAGWKIEGSVMCMECDYAQAKANSFPVTSTMSIVPQRGGSLVNKPVQKSGINDSISAPACEPLEQLFCSGRRGAGAHPGALFV